MEKVKTMITDNELILNIDKIHTTEMGIIRIRKNLKLENADVVSICKEKILADNCIITRKGKNWYVDIDDCIITVNANSYTIITAHKRRSDLIELRKSR